MSSLLDFTGAVRERSRRSRRRLVRLALIAAAVVAVAIGAVYLASSTPLFTARKVVVTGTRRVPADAVRSAAAVPTDVPLARVDTGAVARRVAAVPGVATADVAVALPDTVAVRVVERTLSYVLAADGSFWWVDPSGAVFNESAARPPGIPTAALGSRDARLLADVAAVANALPPRLRGLVGTISASTPDSITLSLTSGVRVVWGGSAESELKASVTERLLAVDAKVIDVSAPTHPTTRAK